MKVRICEDCVGASVHGLPVSQRTKAIALGVIRFFAVMKDPGPKSDAPLETCTECGQPKPVVFSYGSDDESYSDDDCVHCGLSEYHPIHRGNNIDHPFTPKGKPE